MTQKTKCSKRVRGVSLLLVLAMLASLLMLPASAAETASLEVSGSSIYLSEEGQSFTAKLTVPASQVSGDVQAWAEGLTWTLSRDKSEQDPALYPYCYTGDELKDWQSWGTNGTDGAGYFEVGEPVAVSADGKVTVTLTFTNNAFVVNKEGANALGGKGVSNRNVYMSFTGDYDLAASVDGKVLASTVMDVRMYASYLHYYESYETLKEIQKLAEENGRYLGIEIYGESEGGYPLIYAYLSDSEKSVSDFMSTNAIAETDPAALQAKIKEGKLGGKDYRIPFLINNVHPDENPGADAHVNLLRTLATEDTISYWTLTGLLEGEVDTSLFDPKVAAIDGFTGLGSHRISGSEETGHNTGKEDASEYYTISDEIVVDVDEILDNIIFVCVPNENADGRTYNSRRNGNGFDLNRDASNQTQNETYYLYQVVNKWNPVVFAELHGYMEEYLIEPCTPPHEPNMEYDILVENFLRGAEAWGRASLGSMSADGSYDYKFQSYYTPLRDDFTPGVGWSAWDDLCTNYGPSYAMLNCGAMGYTVEIPCSNEASTRVLEYGLYGMIDYVMEHKDDIYRNQLEFFRRGVENEDHRADMEKWYVDMSNNTLESDTWRVPYAENGKYFPEYYVIPVDAESQRDTADAWAMGGFLTRNGVEVRRLTADATVGGTTYKAGSLVVDMYQAKRNYANTVLWQGADASSSGFPDLYSESVSNFPEMRGFDCVPVATVGAFSGKLSDVLTDFAGESLLSGSGAAVVLSNNGAEAVRAVNALLDEGKTVGMITEGAYQGDFLVSNAVFASVKDEFVLTGTAVSELPVAYAISKPTVFLAGRYDAFSGYQITEGYYAQWFSDGYGFINYRNVHQNGTSNYDVMAYDKQLGFTITDEPAQADVIVGNVALNQGESGAAAVAAVKAGVPYIATGTSPLKYIQENLITDLEYASLGMEALHTVEYPTASLITASQVKDADNVIYTYNCGVITSVPEGAQVLIKAADQDAFLAGCCLNEDGTPLDGYVEAFAIERSGMDITVFANSTNNRAHQQDDYQFVTNAIYAKSLTGAALTAAALDQPAPKGFSDVSAGYWAAEGIRYAVANGLMTGTSATTFAPAATTTRGMLMTVLARQAGEDTTGGSVWYEKGMEWAKTAGVSDGTNPGGAITREQLATMLYRYAQSRGDDVSIGADTNILSYNDAQEISEWAIPAMQWAAGEGIITGKTGGLLDPAGTASRAEMAVILMRFLEA